MYQSYDLSLSKTEMIADRKDFLSERDTADLLGVEQKLLNRMGTNWPPKTLKPFVDKGLIVAAKLIYVVAKKTPVLGTRISFHKKSPKSNDLRL